MSKDIQEELDYLKNVKRKEIREKINNARKFCDFNEDATYKDFIEEQYRLEDKIKTLETKLAQVSKDNLNEIPLLNHKLKIKWLADGLVETYCLVSPIEAKVEENYLSVESPLGKVLAYGYLNAILQVDLPNGREDVKIIEITPLND